MRREIIEMTKKELRALPWYGGNKIPFSYLQKFSIASKDSEEQLELPFELRLFLGQMK